MYLSKTIKGRVTGESAIKPKYTGDVRSVYFSDGGFFDGYQSISIKRGKDGISIDVSSMRPEQVTFPVEKLKRVYRKG